MNNQTTFVKGSIDLNIIDIHLTFISKLECTFPIFISECIHLIDFGVFR